MSMEFDKNISDWWHDCNSCQKKLNFSEILGAKVIQFWCYTKLVKNKKCAPTLIFFNEIFLERFGWILALKIDFENQTLALFDSYLLQFNKPHVTIKAVFWSAQSGLQSKMVLSNFVAMIKYLTCVFTRYCASILKCR